MTKKNQRDTQQKLQQMIQDFETKILSLISSFEKMSKYVKTLVHHMDQNQEQFFAILNDENWRQILAHKKDILYVEAQGGDESVFYRKNSKNLVLRMSLKKLCENDPSFVKFYKKYAVNIEHIKQIKRFKRRDYRLFIQYVANPLPVGRVYLRELRMYLVARK